MATWIILKRCQDSLGHSLFSFSTTLLWKLRTPCVHLHLICIIHHPSVISSHLHKPPSLCPSASHLHKPKEWHSECSASTTSTAVSVLFPASVDTGMTPVPSSIHTGTTAGKLPEQPTTVHPRTQPGDSGERTPKGRPHSLPLLLREDNT